MLKKNLKTKIFAFILTVFLLSAMPLLTVSAIDHHQNIRDSSGTLVAKAMMGASTSGIYASTTLYSYPATHVGVQVFMRLRDIDTGGTYSDNGYLTKGSPTVSDSKSTNPTISPAYEWSSKHYVYSSNGATIGSCTLSEG